jgi:hypothetical protein
MPAGTYTLSWTGTATGRVYNVGGTPPAYGDSPQIVTLDGLANVVVEFTPSSGTGTLSLVQLEGGNVFSPFEYRHRGDELALCQRYFEIGRLVNAAYGQVSAVIDSGAYANFDYATTKRAIPTITQITLTLAGSPAGIASGVTYNEPSGFGFRYVHGGPAGGTGPGNLSFDLTFSAGAEL